MGVSAWAGLASHSPCARITYLMSHLDTAQELLGTALASSLLCGAFVEEGSLHKPTTQC